MNLARARPLILGPLLTAMAISVVILVVCCEPHNTPRPTLAPDTDRAHLGNRQFLVRTSQGSGIALYFGNGSLDRGAHVSRAIIIVHGILRNADYYYGTGVLVLERAHASDTLLIAPQFVEVRDLKGRPGLTDVLRWKGDWPGGSAAVGPSPISSYAVFDAMLERLADRTRFPRLRRIVIIGHSAGGQIVQRYAAVGRAPQLVAREALAVQLVVANPSSYLYFDDYRPYPHRSCTDFNHWRYGFIGAPTYVRGAPRQYLGQYVARHVTYLLGSADTNPNEDDLDTSCSAEAQGPYRFARGKSYIRYIEDRQPHGTVQDYAFVKGVGHDNRAMFTSKCGIAVILDAVRSSCLASGRI